MRELPDNIDYEIITTHDQMHQVAKYKEDDDSEAGQYNAYLVRRKAGLMWGGWIPGTVEDWKDVLSKNGLSTDEPENIVDAEATSAVEGTLVGTVEERPIESEEGILVGGFIIDGDGVGQPLEEVDSENVKTENNEEIAEKVDEETIPETNNPVTTKISEKPISKSKSSAKRTSAKTQGKKKNKKKR